MKKTIHYAMILDQSGSMYQLKEAVILSFNEQVDMIRKLAKKENKAEIKFTLCVFNDSVDYPFFSKPVDNLNKLSTNDYQPNSCTALYDAIGKTIVKTRKMVKAGEKVFLTIFTDGLENASKKFSQHDINKKLKQAEEEKWEIRFFCRYGDDDHYKRNLEVKNASFHPINFNKNGLLRANEEIYLCMDRMTKY